MLTKKKESSGVLNKGGRGAVRMIAVVGKQSKTVQPKGKKINTKKKMMVKSGQRTKTVMKAKRRIRALPSVYG